MYGLSDKINVKGNEIRIIIYWADPGLKIGLLFNFSSIPYFSFTE